MAEERVLAVVPPGDAGAGASNSRTIGSFSKDDDDDDEDEGGEVDFVIEPPGVEYKLSHPPSACR